MYIEVKSKRILRLGDQGCGVGASHVHHRQVQAVFDELIHKPWGTARWCPAADIWEQADAFVIELDVPGIASDDVRVLVEGRTLTVEGDRPIPHPKAEHVAHLCERPEGGFSRTFCFEYEVDADRIEHQLTGGVLTVIVPKPEDE